MLPAGYVAGSAIVAAVAAAGAGLYYLLGGLNDKDTQHAPDVEREKAQEVLREREEEAERQRKALAETKRQAQEDLAEHFKKIQEEAEERARKAAEAAKKLDLMNEEARKLRAEKEEEARKARELEAENARLEAAAKIAAEEERVRLAEEAAKKALQEALQKKIEEMKFARKPWQARKRFRKNLNIAILGDAGLGKSSLLNRLNGIEDAAPGAAATDAIKECTKIATPYTWAPKGMPKSLHGLVDIYDMPGCGTPNFPVETYISDFGVRYFDVIIIMDDKRVRDANIRIMKECKKFNIPFLLVRGMVDVALEKHLKHIATTQKNFQLFAEINRWQLPDGIPGAATDCDNVLVHAKRFLSGLRGTVMAAAQKHEAQLPGEDIFLCSTIEWYAFRPVFDLHKLKDAIIRKLVLSRIGGNEEALEAHMNSTYFGKMRKWIPGMKYIDLTKLKEKFYGSSIEEEKNSNAVELFQLPAIEAGDRDGDSNAVELYEQPPAIEAGDRVGPESDPAGDLEDAMAMALYQLPETEPHTEQRKLNDEIESLKKQLADLNTGEAEAAGRDESEDKDLAKQFTKLGLAHYIAAFQEEQVTLKQLIYDPDIIDQLELKMSSSSRERLEDWLREERKRQPQKDSAMCLFGG